MTKGGSGLAADGVRNTKGGMRARTAPDSPRLGAEPQDQELYPTAGAWSTVSRGSHPDLNAAGSSASVRPYIPAIISSRTVPVISYCMSHCGFEGGNILSAWNSNRLRTEKCTGTGNTSTGTVKYQVVHGTSFPSV